MKKIIMSYANLRKQLKLNTFPKTIVIRHKRENLKKCSLRGLESREDFHFLTYPLRHPLPDLSCHFMLDFDAPPLTIEDACKGILVIDATWKYAMKMEQNIPFPKSLERRSLPKDLQTAYPRRQDDCPLPEQGLATIEALYAAYTILQRSNQGLLDRYFWKEPFLIKNLRLSTL